MSDFAVLLSRLADAAWPVAVAIVLATLLLFFRPQVRQLLDSLTGVEGFGFKVSFDKGLRQIEEALPARQNPIGAAQAIDQEGTAFQEIEERLHTSLDDARTRAVSAPEDAIAVAGGALRHTIEAAAKYARLDLTRSSSRMIALVHHGLDKQIVMAAAGLTYLELKALLGKPKAVTSEQSLEYIRVVEEIAERVLNFSARRRARDE